MILIAVMSIIVILMMMITNLASDTSYATQMIATIRAQDRAYYVAQSAVTAVLPLLPATSSYTTLQDPWAIGAPPLKIDGYIVSVKISDEERYINPNAMLNSDGQTTNNDQVNMFEHLLRNIGQRDVETTNAILDWMDSDSNRRLPGGAEGQDYGERLPKNAPLDSIDEISNVLGVPSDLLSGPQVLPSPSPSGSATPIPSPSVTPSPGSPSQGAAGVSSQGTSAGGAVKHGLREFISVFSNGLVDINTAPQMVIQSLTTNIDASLAAAIIQQREKNPFQSMNDLLNVPGITRDQIYFFQKVADVKSTTWRITAQVAIDTGDANDITSPPVLTLIAIFRGNGTGIKPLAWNLDEIGNGEAEPNGTPSGSPSGFPSGSPGASPQFGASPSNGAGGSSNAGFGGSSNSNSGFGGSSNSSFGGSGH